MIAWTQQPKQLIIVLKNYYPFKQTIEVCCLDENDDRTHVNPAKNEVEKIPE